MNILWFNTQPLLVKDTVGTGNWQQTLANLLVESDSISTLYCINEGNVFAPTEKVHGKIHQWTVPRTKQRTELSPHFVQQIHSIVEDISPDLIQIWGIENIWGLLSARMPSSIPTVITIQGVKRAIAPVYHGGLSLRDSVACIGIKELLRQSSIAQTKRKLMAWGQIEKEIVARHHFFSVQTPWQEAQVRGINLTGHIYQNDLGVRSEFLEGPRRQRPNNRVIFCSISYPAPFKGLHIAMQALSVLQRDFPDIQLRVAGNLQRSGMRQDGYIAWLNRQAKRLGIESRLIWLGGLTAAQLVKELTEAAVSVIPSFIESYSMTAIEAALVGVPLVASYVGGIPSLFRDEETALFFAPGDHLMCAHQLSRVLADPHLSTALSARAYASMASRFSPNRILERELEIYGMVSEQFYIV